MYGISKLVEEPTRVTNNSEALIIDINWSLYHYWTLQNLNSFRYYRNLSETNIFNINLKLTSQSVDVKHIYENIEIACRNIIDKHKQSL